MNRSSRTKLSMFITWSVISSVFFSCEQDILEEKNENLSPNWEIVNNFPQDKSYINAKIAGQKNDIFLTTFGHYSINNQSHLSNDLKGAFYFKQDRDWYANQRTHNAVIELKEFNNELYGIRLNKTIFSTYPSITYHHSYTLFKWKNETYEDIDVLEYTNSHQIEKSDIGEVKFWVFNNKLHLIAHQTSVLVWEIVNNKFVKKAEELSAMVDDAMTFDNKEVAFTQELQLIINPVRTRYVVTSYHYNGSTFRFGKTYEFIIEDDTQFSNKEAAKYQAFDGNIWGIGFEGNKIKNLDTDKVFGGLHEEKILRSHPVITNSNKVFITVATKQNNSKCESIVVFDGQKMLEIPFRLPEILDSNSTVVDAMMHNNKIYLLLNNRGQYVVVKH